MFDSESHELYKGIDLFNNQDYFSAHDFFENMWNEASGDKKLFFQGLVQISVGCFHSVSGNLNGAESQFRKAENKLKNFNPCFLNVNVKKLLEDILLFIKQIEAFHDNDFLKLDLRLLPKINFINK